MKEKMSWYRVSKGTVEFEGVVYRLRVRVYVEPVIGDCHGSIESVNGKPLTDYPQKIMSILSQAIDY